MTPFRHAARRLATGLLVLCTATTACLDESLIKQPELTVLPGAPPGWSGTAGTPGIGLTITDVRSGSNAAYLSNAFQINFGSFRIVQSVRADNYRGKRLRLSAWVRPRNIGSVASSGIFLRVDGPGITLGLDDMTRRPVYGLGDWRQVAVVLDVPERAVGISFGALFQASNTLLVDDMRLEVVSTTVESTNMLSAPVPSGIDSLATAEAYARSPSSPVNLDFEGLASVGGATSAWLLQNSTVLGTSDPTASLDDLQPFQAMVGNAGVVGLGDATNGTRELQRLKDRLLRVLVTRMGFRTITIDAPAAETDDLNAYVTGGTGDPARLMSRLYSWNLNTQEIAELIAWLRQWNATVPPEQRVHLFGLDVQYPGASMDSVAAFVHRVAPAFDVDITVWYECLAVFRNRGTTAGRPRTEYAALPADSRGLCADGIRDALDLVTARGVGAPGYSAAVRHARLVVQFEAVAAAANTTIANRARDLALADNLIAIRELRGADSRVAVWAHNDRVTRQAGAMGARLHAQYGASYRPLAFTFGTGQFNAQLQQGATLSSPQAFTVQVVLTGSIEEAALATNASLLLLDARKVAAGSADAAPLSGPIAMRTIGLGFTPNSESTYFPTRLFPGDFDLLVFVREGTRSTLLPFVN